jgi:KAP family P-loop domain
MPIDPANVVMVHAQNIDASSVIGSGYLLNDHIAITAAFLLNEKNVNDVQVRQMGATDWIPGRPVWTSADSEVALLELAPQSASRANIAATRWATIGGTDPVPCTAVGFPHFQARPDGGRDAEQVFGEILPLSGSVSGRLNINVRSPVPETRPSEGTPWAGMAGAAVFAGDYMVGVVVQAPEWGNARLIATTISPLAVDRSFADLVAPSGGEPVVIGAASNETGAQAAPPSPDRVDLSVFSSTIRDVVSELGAETEVTASGVADKVRIRHSDYADSRFGSVSLDVRAGKPRKVSAWLAAVRNSYDLAAVAASKHRVIDGRLTLIALAMLDSSLATALGDEIVSQLAAESSVAPTRPQPPSPREHVRWLADEPVGLDDDQLGRVGVARALDKQLLELVQNYPGRSFLVQIDGPWGAGKSTLLRFLREIVERRKADPWLVIQYDAWRQSRAGPPWLTLLSSVRTAVRADQRSWVNRVRFWLLERARLLSAWQLVAMLLVLVAAAAAIVALLLSGNGLALGRAGDFIRLLGGLVTVVATGWLFSASVGRFIALDSRRAARTFIENRADPMEDLAHHFDWMLRQVAKPILLLIDDLDRCPENFVVDLLDATQKLMRDRDIRPSRRHKESPASNLLVIVASDGRWIRRSYDAAYASVASAVREPGATIGSLFLEKLFQLTVPVPRLSDDLKTEYLSGLLATTSADGRPPESSLSQRLRKIPRGEVLPVLATASPLERVRASDVAIERLVVESGAREETKHALESYAYLLDPTPRAMKRFIMSYSMLRAVRTAEGSVVPLRLLALWTILQNRWPLLADHLQEHPEDVKLFQERPEQFDSSMPEEIAPLFTNPPNSLREVMNHPDGPLTTQAIRECCGQTISAASSNGPSLMAVNAGTTTEAVAAQDGDSRATG